MTDLQIYIDNAEVGLSRKTSHPNFIKYMKDELYYDCSNNLSPFGNDDGSDLLYSLEEWYQAKGTDEELLQFFFQLFDSYGFALTAATCVEVIEPAKLEEIAEQEVFMMSCLNRSMVALCFGQIKITGKINEDVFRLGMFAFERMLLDADEFKHVFEKTRQDLIDFYLDQLLRSKTNH